MPSDDDDGYCSNNEDDGDDVVAALPGFNLVDCNIRRPRQLRPRFCVVQGYVKWGEHVCLCMRCYTHQFAEVDNVNFISNHFTVARAHSDIMPRCRLCRDRLFIVYHQSACLICRNRM